MSWISYFFKIFYFLFIISKCPQALYVNPGCLKCISCINLSPANKNFLTISFILHFVLTCLNKRESTKGILLKGVFISKLLNNPLDFCCLISFDFLLSHTTQFLHTKHYSSVFCTCNFWTVIFCIFLHFNQ